MERAIWWGLGGLGAGMGAMYLMDPRSGRTRRTHLQDQAIHASHALGDAVGKVARDLEHRTQGVVARSWGRLHREHVDDTTLEARVRSALGRVCSHPGAVEVQCQDGRVVLRGSILRAEHRQVLSCVRRVRGVRGVEDQLTPQRRANGNPDLQGGIARPGVRPELLQSNWSPSTRFLVGMGGVWLALRGMREGGLLGTLTGALGAAVALRGFSNRELKRLVGVGAGRRAIELQKTITVRAPVDEVYAFWSSFGNFPRFMAHVHEVRVDGDRSHWVVHGPAGTRFAWDAVVTQRVPSQLLAWKSEEGALVENAGIIRFEGVDPRTTRLDIHLSYNPPAGALGHAFARLLGADPKRQMDDDLLRFKSLLEDGKATGHETVTREELSPGLPVSGAEMSTPPGR